VLFLYQVTKLWLPEFAREILPTFFPRFLGYLDRKSLNDDFDEADLIYFDLKFTSPCTTIQFKEINQLDATISPVYY